MAEDRKHVAVSVSVKVTLTSNSAHVNSAILLRCYLNRIDHQDHPLPSKCSRESDQEANWAPLLGSIVCGCMSDQLRSTVYCPSARSSAYCDC